MKPERCPLCNRGALEVSKAPNGDFLVDCKTCSKLYFSEELLEDRILEKGDIKPKRYLLSALARASKERVVVDDGLLDRVRSGTISDKTVPEKMEMILRWCADHSAEVGQLVAYDKEADFPTAWCRSPDEWQAIFGHLVNDLRWLAVNNDLARPRCAVTIKGWQWLGERPKAAGNRGFIAMSFDPSLDDVSEAIHAGIRQAGYQPYRVKEDDYVGGVMDRIIARIRESRFVVADLTKNRGGVYYEGGFAAGLGIPVFILSDQRQLNPRDKQRVHFDVAHINILPWTRENLPELTQRLRDRIVAVIGVGPVSR